LLSSGNDVSGVIVVFDRVETTSSPVAVIAGWYRPMLSGLRGSPTTSFCWNCIPTVSASMPPELKSVTFPLLEPAATGMTQGALA